MESGGSADPLRRGEAGPARASRGCQEGPLGDGPAPGSLKGTCRGVAFSLHPEDIHFLSVKFPSWILSLKVKI